MMKAAAIFLLLFVVDFVCPQYDPLTVKPTFEQLLIFLNTSQTIWTVIITADDTTPDVDERCVSEIKTGLSRETYLYNECYTEDYESKTCYSLKASLGSGTGSGPTIDGRYQSGLSNHLYTAVAYNETEKCLVYTYINNGQRECEMRVQDEGASKTGGSVSMHCELEFDNHCPNRRKYKLYYHDCQNVKNQLESI